MLQSHKLSFYITIALVFLIPIFFIPGGAVALGMAKSSLLILGVALASLAFVYETWRAGGVVLPRHYLMLVVALLPVVYLLSALLATPSSLSLFGYGFEVGTFGFILLGAAILVLVSAIYTDASRVLHALLAFFLSFVLLALFSLVKILFGGDLLTLGNFFGNMGNPLGSWTDMAVAFGLLAVVSALTLGVLPMKGLMKWLLTLAFVAAMFLLVVINFQTAFIFTLIASVLMYVYFLKIENHLANGESGERGSFMGGKLLPIVLGIISLVFLVNPNIGSDRTLGSVVSGVFGINNTEVRPSFSATLGVSKAVLSQVALLGSGPNTFGHDWLIYKPANINATPFWAATFPFGAGFLPTQIATTGILGSALWLAFFVLLIVLGVRAVAQIPMSRAERFTTLTTLLGSLFLWGTSFFYAPSGTMIMLAFIFTGLFLASLVQTRSVSSYVIDIRRTPQAKLASVLALLLIAAGSIYIGWIGSSKAISAYHFGNAVKLSNVEGTPLSDIESSLLKAIETSAADVYFVALSRLNFTRAQMAANSATGTPEENRAIFEESVRISIEAARRAVSENPAGFENWVALGNIYTSLVPEPLKVPGSYENALYAYNEAARRNPTNPELPLLLAQLELNNKNVDNARAYIRNSIALKQDYADAYLMLAQLEVGAGNTQAAIQSAEALAVLLPQNPGIHFELGVLKFSAKNFEGAALSLEKALELSPDYANAKYYLALTYANLGKFAEAQAHLEDLMAANPGNTDLEAALNAVKANKVPALPGSNSASNRQ